MVKPDLPTIVEGNAAELVTVALPFVAVTVNVRDDPRLDGLNGTCPLTVLEITISVARALPVSARATKKKSMNFFIMVK